MTKALFRSIGQLKINHLKREGNEFPNIMSKLGVTSKEDGKEEVLEDFIVLNRIILIPVLK